jgi:hypothetical protein
MKVTSYLQVCGTTWSHKYSRGTYCLHLSGTRDTPVLMIDVADSSEALAGIYHTTPHPKGQYSIPIVIAVRT